MLIILDFKVINAWVNFLLYPNLGYLLIETTYAEVVG